MEAQSFAQRSPQLQERPSGSPLRSRGSPMASSRDFCVDTAITPEPVLAVSPHRAARSADTFDDWRSIWFTQPFRQPFRVDDDPSSLAPPGFDALPLQPPSETALVLP